MYCVRRLNLSKSSPSKLFSYAAYAAADEAAFLTIGGDVGNVKRIFYKNPDSVHIIRAEKYREMG